MVSSYPVENVTAYLFSMPIGLVILVNVTLLTSVQLVVRMCDRACVIIILCACMYYTDTYRIAQNFGGGKLWRIWRNERHSPMFYPTKFQVHY